MSPKVGGGVEGGGNSTYQKALVFCRFSDTAEQALRHLHPGSTDGKSTPNTFAHVQKSGTATAPRGKSGILIKIAFVSVGVRETSEIPQHAKNLALRK